MLEKNKPLDETCSVCQRVRWGEYQPTGFGHWRHAECFAGSKTWLEVQSLKPENKRSELYVHFFDRNNP